MHWKVLLPVLFSLIWLPQSIPVADTNPVTLSQTVNAVQEQAAKQEINRIKHRDAVRDIQLQHTIQLYAKLKRQSIIYSYKNQHRNRFMYQQCINITRDIYIDKQADLQRLHILQQDSTANEK